MSRDLSCFSGKECFKTKAEAEAAYGPAKRCDHCRWWHGKADTRGQRGGRGRRTGRAS